MTAISQIRPATFAASASNLARAYTWLKRARANARARRSLARSLAHVDARTLRDIGFTRREIAVFSHVSAGR
jgi:uncharacterized protein YjiS (DUF1127 family)